MIKKIVSMLLPSNEKLAAKAAASIKNEVNGQADDKKVVIAKYATLAAELTAITQTLADVLKDGAVDEVEEATLTKLLTPLFAKAREIVGV